MGEVAAHQPARLVAVFGAALAIEIGNLLQTAEAHRGRERRNDQTAIEPRGKLDRGFRKRRDIERHRVLDRLRRDRHILELVMLAIVVDALAARTPELAENLHAFVEDRLVVIEGDAERQIFPAVVAAAGGKIDASAGKQIKCRPLFGDADRIVQRQHRNRGRKADMFGARSDISQHHFRRGIHAERIEMMLADPGRMHADLVGV